MADAKVVEDCATWRVLERFSSPKGRASEFRQKVDAHTGLSFKVTLRDFEFVWSGGATLKSPLEGVHGALYIIGPRLQQGQRTKQARASCSASGPSSRSLSSPESFPTGGVLWRFHGSGFTHTLFSRSRGGRPNFKKSASVWPFPSFGQDVL